jgi:hypothetical protein
MLRKFLKLANPEIAFGFLIATVFWIGVLGWQAAYTPSEMEKHQCEESAHKAGHKTEECKTFWERTTTDPVAFFTFWLVVSTIGLGISTCLLWVAGEKQFEFLTRNATEQAVETKNSIAEAARAATAMERVASGIAISARAAENSVATIRERTALQMRAYISVNINNGVYQERERGLRFDVRPIVFNSGNTPAHNLTYWATARILPQPLPEDFDFPQADDIKSRLVLGPHQNILINATVPDFVDDAEVEEIKSGFPKRVYIWEAVLYEDVFGEFKETKFCHSLFWVTGPQGELVSGNYTARHNEAT